jgi:hypothetical protein
VEYKKGIVMYTHPINYRFKRRLDSYYEPVGTVSKHEEYLHKIETKEYYSSDYSKPKNTYQIKPEYTETYKRRKRFIKFFTKNKGLIFKHTSI